MKEVIKPIKDYDGYFISNLIEDIHLVHCGESIPENLRNVFYPITETKEPHKIADIFLEE